MHSIYYNILVSVPSFPPSSTHSFESQTIQLNEYFNTPTQLQALLLNGIFGKII